MTAVGIITPIKDEAENLPRLIDSVVDQSLRPERWVIVDDGSTDGSSSIIAEAASSYPWIRHERKTDTDEYDIGVNYARVLARGFAELENEYGDALDYYAVLDGDMELSETHLETVASYLDASDDVVIACGPVYTRGDDGLEFEERREKHPFGGATLYDGDFYRAIGGPPLTPCVDSVTKAKAHMRGYRPRYATELDVRAVQARPPHENGDPLANARTLGRNNYAIGYPPVAALAKSARLAVKSTFPRGVSYLGGYLSAWLGGDPRVVDDEVIRYYTAEKHRDVVRGLRRKVRETLASG